MSASEVKAFLALCVACETLLDVTLSGGAVVSGLYFGRDETALVVHEPHGDITKLLFVDVQAMTFNVRGFDEADDSLSQVPDRFFHLRDGLSAEDIARMIVQ